MWQPGPVYLTVWYFVTVTLCLYSGMACRGAAVVASRQVAGMQSRRLRSCGDSHAGGTSSVPALTAAPAYRASWAGLGQMRGFGAESVTGKNRKQDLRVIISHSRAGPTQYWSQRRNRDNQVGLGNWCLRCFTGKPWPAHSKPHSRKHPE